MTIADNKFDPYIQVGGIDWFKGEMLSVSIRQDDLPGHIGNKVIDPRKDFFIDMQWQLTGTEVALRMFAVSDWKINVYCESMGPGPEMSLGSISVPKGDPVPGITYNYSFKVPAGTLPEHSGDSNSGIYKLVIAIFANAIIQGPFDVIGFEELPFLIGVENPL
ncbi:MAG: hypothetical protein HGA60_00340 [Chlorobiaceae bacterium]|nr:hypothetical protein [Chlorobiaceae bacterium]